MRSTLRSRPPGSERKRRRNSDVPLRGQRKSDSMRGSHGRHFRSLTSSSVPRVGGGARLTGRCLAASENIRLHRNAAYSHPATLVTRRSSIVFFPVTERDRRFVVPFAWQRDGERQVDGELSLRAVADPLPIRVKAAPPIEEEAELWASVLLGYEALAVLPEEVMIRRTARATAPRRGAAPRRTPAPPSLPRYPASRRISPSLTPTGRTLHAHWVTGHIRILPEGWSCSSGARREAFKVGISLSAGETWVRPHARGLGADERLTFTWRVPDEAASLI